MVFRAAFTERKHCEVFRSYKVVLFTHTHTHILMLARENINEVYMYTSTYIGHDDSEVDKPNNVFHVIDVYKCLEFMYFSIYGLE